MSPKRLQKEIIPSMPCQAVTIWFQVLFTPNQMGSFQHSLAVLNTLSVLRNIQNWKSMPPKDSRPISDERYSRKNDTTKPPQNLRDYHPLRLKYSNNN